MATCLHISTEGGLTLFFVLPILLLMIALGSWASVALIVRILIDPSLLAVPNGLCDSTWNNNRWKGQGTISYHHDAFSLCNIATTLAIICHRQQLKMPSSSKGITLKGFCHWFVLQDSNSASPIESIAATRKDFAPLLLSVPPWIAHPFGLTHENGEDGVRYCRQQSFIRSRRQESRPGLTCYRHVWDVLSNPGIMSANLTMSYVDCIRFKRCISRPGYSVTSAI